VDINTTAFFKRQRIKGKSRFCKEAGFFFVLVKNYGWWQKKYP